MAALGPPYYATMGTIATLFGPRGYSTSKQTMSQLAAPTAPRPEIINAGFLGYAFLVQGLGPLLHREAGGGRRGRMLWGLIALYGIGGAMAGMFPTEGRKHVLPGLTEDRAHHYGGVLSYAAILSLLVITPCFLSKRSDWRSWRWFSAGAVGATIGLAAPYQMRIWTKRRGLLQRGFFASTMAWILVTALRLRPPPTENE